MFHVSELTVRISALELGNPSEDRHSYMEKFDRVP